MLIDRSKCFLPHRGNRLDKSTTLIKKDQNYYTYSILHLYLLIIIKHIDKAASHQLLYENSISYVISFSNTIIYDGNKDSYIYNGSVHLKKTYSLKGALYFRSGLQKQKNNFFVYIDYVLYSYFSGLSLR